MPSSDTTRCYTCQKTVTLRCDPQEFTDGSRHLRGTCPFCHRWIKWVSWDEPRLYIGKYANQSIRTIVQRDPTYLQWALTTLRLSAVTRVAIQEAFHAHA